MTPFTCTTVSITSVRLPTCRSKTRGSIFHFFESILRESSTQFGILKGFNIPDIRKPGV
jgi:hypothetical protein